MLDSQSLRERSQESDTILCTLGSLKQNFHHKAYNKYVNFVKSDIDMKLRLGTSWIKQHEDAKLTHFSPMFP